MVRLKQSRLFVKIIHSVRIEERSDRGGLTLQPCPPNTCTFQLGLASLQDLYKVGYPSRISAMAGLLVKLATFLSLESPITHPTAMRLEQLVASTHLRMLTCLRQVMAHCLRFLFLTHYLDPRIGNNFPLLGRVTLIQTCRCSKRA
jgi:hypothetical protein